MTLRRENARNRRRALGLTALGLAEIAHLTEEKVYQVERGRYNPTPEEGRRWAAALGVDAGEIFPDLFPAEGVTP